MAGAGGASQRDHILEACRQTGKEMPIPEDGLYLWFFFQELCGGRGNNGFGPTALSWSDMEAWARLTSAPLSPYEVLTLRSMDAAFLAAYAKETERHNKNKGKQ